MGIGCERASVDEPAFIDTIFAIIKSKLELARASEDSVAAQRKAQTAKRDAELHECETRLKKLKLSHTTLLEQFLDGKLTKDKYQAQKAQTAAAIVEAAGQLSALEIQAETTSEFIESHMSFFGQDALTSETLRGLIQEIRVTSADEIEIIWKFGEFYRNLQGIAL